MSVAEENNGENVRCEVSKFCKRIKYNNEAKKCNEKKMGKINGTVCIIFATLPKDLRGKNI